jgi:TM2 domain-containing membrane protein YozV
MKCSYHPFNTASANCSACDRSLCAACDHRIKGLPYCQDCIVTGIEILRRGEVPRLNQRTDKKSPFLAFLFGLIPGLGAAYNGQNVKALSHFVAIVGLLTLIDVFRSPFSFFFAMAAAAFYIYSLYDAYTSTHRLRAGENLLAEDQRIRLFLRERTNVWGGILVIIGTLAAFNAIFPQYLNRWSWPLILIFTGLYLLRGFYYSARENRSKPAYPTPPPSVIDRTTANFAEVESRTDR